MTTLAIAIAVLAIVVTAAALLVLKPSKYARLPPGPPRNWPVGTPASAHPWRSYYDLSKRYGGLITVWNGTKPSVICSDVAT